MASEEVRTASQPRQLARGYKPNHHFGKSKPLPHVNKSDVDFTTSVGVGHTQYPLLTGIKNQGRCGSCWAHSAIEQLESDSIVCGEWNKNNISDLGRNTRCVPNKRTPISVLSTEDAQNIFKNTSYKFEGMLSTVPNLSVSPYMLSVQQLTNVPSLGSCDGGNPALGVKFLQNNENIYRGGGGPKACKSVSGAYPDLYSIHQPKLPQPENSPLTYPGPINGSCVNKSTIAAQLSPYVDVVYSDKGTEQKIKQTYSSWRQLPVAKLKNPLERLKSEHTLIAHLKDGPVSAAVDANGWDNGENAWGPSYFGSNTEKQNFFDKADSNKYNPVFSPDNNPEPLYADHAVQVVGYNAGEPPKYNEFGDECPANGWKNPLKKKYFVVRNSWTNMWGVDACGNIPDKEKKTGGFIFLEAFPDSKNDPQPGTSTSGIVNFELGVTQGAHYV